MTAMSSDSYLVPDLRASAFWNRFSRWMMGFLIVLVAVLLIAPIAWLLIASLKKPEELMAYPFVFWPETPQWSNYAQVFTMMPFLKIALRTIVLGITSGSILVFTSAMCGYAFARFQGRANKFFFTFVVALLIVPGIVTMIPQFILYTRLHLTNTYLPWYLGALGASPYFIFMFRQFFYGFPKEIEEAAEIDGCGPMRMFWQVFLPNAKPVIATAFIFSLSGMWGDYLTPVLYLSEDKTLLAVKMATSYLDPKGNPLPTVTLAANVIYTLPLVLLFFVGQKFIMQGVVTSGLKG
jgi:ABC-type glycerol-3-phosphate transport system permease component